MVRCETGQDWFFLGIGTKQWYRYRTGRTTARWNDLGRIWSVRVVCSYFYAYKDLSNAIFFQVFSSNQAGYSLIVRASRIDPFDAIRSVAGLPTCCVLASGNSQDPLSNHWLMAARPRGTFKIAGEQWKLSDDWPGPRPASTLSAWDAFGFLIRQTGGQTAEKTDPIFTGGWIGYLGYDLRRLFEKLPNRHPRQGRLPDCTIRYYDTFALCRRPFDSLEIIGIDRFGEGAGAVHSRLAQFEALLTATDSTDCGQPFVDGPPEDEMGKSQFLQSIERIKEYLRAGDIFQANFTHRFSRRFAGPIDQLFLRSQSRSPAPFGALLRYGSDAIVSTSPERFFLLEPNGAVETRPIKGTRRRGKTAEEDQRLIAELSSSEKDHAELAMIVDVERNDFGRVCIPGSIAVPRHAEIETYSNVHHLVSTVVGKLQNGLDVVDLIAAIFPGGSITGAPKIRAMEIIDELETCRRGVYTGAIGYISDNGRADFNIAIRTMIIEAGLAHYHVGGGIVIDSDAESEYNETLTKGERMKQILMGNSRP